MAAASPVATTVAQERAHETNPYVSERDICEKSYDKVSLYLFPSRVDLFIVFEMDHERQSRIPHWLTHESVQDSKRH